MPRSQGTSRKGKPKKGERASGMGRTLLRAQKTNFKPKDNGSSLGNGMAASGAGDWGVDKAKEKERVKMVSVLEVDNLEDFISKAEMEERAFESQKERFVVIDELGSNVKSADDIGRYTVDAKGTDIFDWEGLKVPRRPAWNETTTPQELDRMEKEAFLNWRREIASLTESRNESNKDNDASVTPFEKNIEVWRQLWRVIERVDIVVQIVDARNPIFYLSDDLRKYVEEELGKKMIVLVNKSDYLSANQRVVWHEHLKEKGIVHIFASAWEEQKILDESRPREEAGEEEQEGGEDKDILPPPPPRPASDPIGVQTLLSRQELLTYMHSVAKKHGIQPNPRYQDRLQFGFVGFPNVGKSSIINVLVGSAKHAHGVTRVGVASQPGKTKHFQTLLIPDDDLIMLCDCPGLVFPSFVSSTADMIAAGVYPIAQMRNFWPVVGLICQRVPRKVLNGTYGFQIPINYPEGWTDPLPPPPSAEELLTTFCTARSMVSAGSGVPDWQRASRVVVKDYVEGKLLFNHAPPELEDVKAFEIDTHILSMKLCKRLNDAWTSEVAKVEKAAEKAEKGEKAVDEQTAEELADDLDLDMLDFLNGEDEEKVAKNKGRRGKAHKSMQKWGKKGRKQREKDPYGCHEDTAAKLLEGQAGLNGVNVSGGKRGRKGYTRPSYTPKAAALTTSSLDK
ncbi:hypothetical protein TrRE_jg1087 [Triparma retinervis]|uniref:CP-type G domain-containing protein n=1 Tax=Triparma retinervis TaxID=2557542 RepID=A0A9W7E3U2_9STRA|nr:hypothetical protein TrRE_jg1087 [Triparma retinervis]